MTEFNNNIELEKSDLGSMFKSIVERPIFDGIVPFEGQLVNICIEEFIDDTSLLRCVLIHYSKDGEPLVGCIDNNNFSTKRQKNGNHNANSFVGGKFVASVLPSDSEVIKLRIVETNRSRSNKSGYNNNNNNNNTVFEVEKVRLEYFRWMKDKDEIVSIWMKHFMPMIKSFHDILMVSRNSEMSFKNYVIAKLIEQEDSQTNFSDFIEKISKVDSKEDQIGINVNYSNCSAVKECLNYLNDNFIKDINIVIDKGGQYFNVKTKYLSDFISYVKKSRYNDLITFDDKKLESLDSSSLPFNLEEFKETLKVYEDRLSVLKNVSDVSETKKTSEKKNVDNVGQDDDSEISGNRVLINNSTNQKIRKESNDDYLSDSSCSTYNSDGESD